MWICEENCFNLVEDSWSKEEAGNIMKKIIFCCLKLEEWGGGMVKEMRYKLQWYKCELRKYRSRRDEVGVRNIGKLEESS